jgi:hypothetical protein
MKAKGKKSLIGRPSFSSAMHCLLETVETYSEFMESASLTVKFVLECGEVLLSHDARTKKKGGTAKHRNTVLGPILHQYAKTSVTIGVDEHHSSQILERSNCFSLCGQFVLYHSYVLFCLFYRSIMSVFEQPQSIFNAFS